MSSEETLRDKFAMSMPQEGIPVINDPDELVAISEKLGIDCNPSDSIDMIQWSMDYQAAIRYKYADAMIAARYQEER